MRPVNCPFEAADRVLASIPDSISLRLVDMHGEATSDKQAMGYYLDGRVSAVLGTHTHVPTADEQILPGGTAFQCDVGMTGPHRSILGREIDPVLRTTLTFDPNTFHVATEDVRVSATWFDVEVATGRAKKIGRLQFPFDPMK
jgi:calcineurin-like phosphoesterase